MKKIGIIDYFIDEWHSNKYLGLFEQANKELGLDYKVVYGWAETDKEGRLTTKEWCEKKQTDEVEIVCCAKKIDREYLRTMQRCA